MITAVGTIVQLYHYHGTELTVLNVMTLWWMLTEQKIFELERQQVADHSRLESEAKAAAELRWQVSDLGNHADNSVY